MPKKLKFQIIVVFLISFVSAIISFAGQTGKVAGKVTDSTTGEILIGANVIISSKWIEGVEQPLTFVYGASTDFNGEYFILNIQPGLYTVKVSYIGYQSEVVTKVAVDVDKTTTVDFKITEQQYQTDEVTVVAYSPKKVEPDVTATKQVYNISDVQSIAGVADITDILQLQADVVDDHFRGGRAGETQYLLSGGSIVNPLTNSRAFSPIVTGMQQVEVYTSGFSAEYGNAQSGVVNMMAREGSDVWQTRVEGAVIPPYYKTWNGSPYNPDNLYFYNELKNLESWLEENPTQPGRPLYDAGYGFSGVYLPERNVWPPNPLTRADSLFVAKFGQTSWMQSIRDLGLEYDNTPDIRLDFTTGGPIAKNLKNFTAARINTETPQVPLVNSDLELQVMSNFTYQLNKENKFGFRIIYDKTSEGYLNSSWLRWMFDRTFYVTQNRNNTIQYSFNWNRILDEATVLDMKFNILDSYSENRIELLQDGEFLEEYSNGTNWVDYTGPSNHTIGKLADDRGEQQTYSYDFNASVLSQISRYNLVKAGFQFTYHELLVNQEVNVTNQGSYRKVKFDAYPYEGGLYIQDKLELAGFIANIGLRFDFYNFNTNYYSDLYSPLRNENYDPSKPYLERGQYYDPELATTKDTKMFYQLQPRIGFSFPLSESTVFHLNYGTFTQRPAFNQVFYSQVTSFNEIEVLGNPRLKPENTKAYDIGLVQAFDFGMKLDIGAYYKDVTDLVETAYFYDEQQSVYRTYINRDYADIKGFSVNLEQTIGDIRGYVRYNYESATGKSSNSLDAPITFFENPAEGQEAIDLPDPGDVYMDYDRTHKLVFNLRYLTPKDLFLIGDMSFSATYKFYSGRPYTWDVTGKGLKYNQRTPDEHNIRMRVEKKFHVNRTNITVYVEGFNLFNEEVYNYSRTFNNDRNTPKWENDRENILTYDEYYPYVTDQSAYLLTNSPRHFRIGAVVKF
ncbi:MAG: TonB-dependent receptor [Melioribacteraceae bacterium]|nr:TonB-dependent receptor [Melioribacteraceae bacterium]